MTDRLQSKLRPSRAYSNFVRQNVRYKRKNRKKTRRGEYEDGPLWVVAIIALMAEVLSASEMSAYFYQTTTRHNPEDNYLQKNYINY